MIRVICFSNYYYYYYYYHSSFHSAIFDTIAIFKIKYIFLFLNRIVLKFTLFYFFYRHQKNMWLLIASLLRDKKSYVSILSFNVFFETLVLRTKLLVFSKLQNSNHIYFQNYLTYKDAIARKNVSKIHFSAYKTPHWREVEVFNWIYLFLSTEWILKNELALEWQKTEPKNWYLYCFSFFAWWVLLSHDVFSTKKLDGRNF